MSFRIIADSCCDRTERMKDWNNITFVPLTLNIDDYSIQDDENFDQDDFIRRTLESKNVPKTACQSPEAFASPAKIADSFPKFLEKRTPVTFASFSPAF